MYVNGVQQTDTETGAVVAATNNFVLGRELADTDSTYAATRIGYAAYYNNFITESQATQNFNALADRFRDHPLTGIVKEGLVLQLDAANAKDKLRANADGTCTNTTWPDLSGNGNDGTLANFSSCGASSGWNGDGSVGDPYRLKFGGDGDKTTIPTSTSLEAGGDNYTFELWVNVQSSTKLRTPIVDSSGYPWFQLKAGRSVTYRINSNDSIDISTLPTGWHHIILIGSSDGAKVYINGSLAGQHATIAGFSGEVSIGNRLGSSSSYSNLAKSYIAKYNRALSTDEIKQNCNALEHRFTAGDDICAN